jgi:hypothetical protein
VAEAGRGRYCLGLTLLSFKRHRFPPEIIQHAVWLYARFSLSVRDVEDLLAERAIDVSNETLRCWFLKLGRRSPSIFGVAVGAPVHQCALAPRGDGHQGPWSETLVMASC